MEQTKADNHVFQQIKDLNALIQRNISQLQIQQNKLDTCSNYIDKYLPIQVHREVTRFLKFIFESNRDYCNRVDWYDEIKTPLLTSIILCDTGNETLERRIE